MKKQYFINANIIDPHNSINEVGGLIIGEDGKIEAIGKKVNENNSIKVSFNDFIVKAKIKLVTVNYEGRPIKIPSVLENKLTIS